MQNISPEFIDELKRELKRETTEVWGGGICHGRVYHIPAEGTELRRAADTHSACHSWVTSAFSSMCYAKAVYSTSKWDQPYRKDAKNFVVLNCVRNHKDNEAVDSLVKWMARESPFSEFILNRDDDESLKYGVLLLCGPDGLNCGQANWVCKVLRFPTEGGKAVDTFHTLIKGGVTPMLAVYVASYIRGFSNNKFKFTGTESHMAVFGKSSYRFGKNRYDDIRAIVEAKMNPNPASTFDLFGGYDGQKEDPSQIIPNFCKPMLMADGWGGTVKAEGATPDQLVQQVLKWQTEILAKGAPAPVADTSGVFLNVDL